MVTQLRTVNGMSEQYRRLLQYTHMLNAPTTFLTDIEISCDSYASVQSGLLHAAAASMPL
jgi:hypothetical protein